MSAQFRNIILSPLFLICLFLLLLNDFYLKAEFHNFFTGKLSDFAGLFIFPLFLCAIFPKKQNLIFFLVGAFFVFWKSPFSEVFIDSWNRLPLFDIGRVVDYTDLSALIVLPVSYFYREFLMRKPIVFRKRALSAFIVLLSVFAFTATSYEDDRTIYYDLKYDVDFTPKVFEEKLRAMEKVSNFDIRDDSFIQSTNSNFNPDAKHFSFFFDFEQNYCDSRKIRAFMDMEKNAHGRYVLELNSLFFRCKRDPTDEDKKEILALFEREIMEKLRQNNF